MINLKTAILLLFFAAFTSWSLYGQCSLTIEVNGLRNSKGQVHLELGNVKGEKISSFEQPIENGKSHFEIKNLKPGNYSFKYYHDENNNQELDTNFIGMPKEGIGFANNAKGKYGPPPLEKTIIDVQGDSSLVCTILYL